MKKIIKENTLIIALSFFGNILLQGGQSDSNLNSGNPLVAELTGGQGFDWCMVDCQHSPYSSRNMAQMFTAIQMTGAKAWVRVGGPSDRFGIQQAFDLGADGILVPYINTADDVRAAISVAKYPGKEGKEGRSSRDATTHRSGDSRQADAPSAAHFPRCTSACWR